MPLVIGGFSGGTGSRYKLVRTNYLIGRIGASNQVANGIYNDQGASNFLNLVNQSLPNELKADYLCLMNIDSGTASFGDTNVISPNIIDLEGNSASSGARFVPLIGPSYRSLAQNSNYTSYTDGIESAPSANTMLRAHDLIKKTNGVIQELLCSAMCRLEITTTASGTSNVVKAVPLPLTTDDLSPLDQARFRLMISQFDARADSASSLLEGGSMFNIGFFIKESGTYGSAGVVWGKNHRLALNWSPTSDALTTNFIAKGNAQERVATTFAQVFGGLGGVAEVEITDGGTGYSGKYIMTNPQSGSLNGVACEVRIAGTSGGAVQFVDIGNSADTTGGIALDPGHSYAVGETITLTTTGGEAGNDDAVLTVTAVKNQFGLLSVVGIVDTDPAGQ